MDYKHIVALDFSKHPNRPCGAPSIFQNGTVRGSPCYTSWITCHRLAADDFTPSPAAFIDEQDSLERGTSLAGALR